MIYIFSALGKVPNCGIISIYRKNLNLFTLIFYWKITYRAVPVVIIVFLNTGKGSLVGTAKQRGGKMAIYQICV